MKFEIILFFIEISVISTKTVNYPNLCGPQTQKDPLRNGNEFTQNIPQPLTLNNDIIGTPNIQNGRRIIFDEDDIKRSADENVPFNKTPNENAKTNENKAKVNQKENNNLPQEIKKNKTKKPQTLNIDDFTPGVNLNKPGKPVDIQYNPNKTTLNVFANKNSNDVDVTNIRELREHLLDHLLDYFINIIKEEEQFTETRKNGNDKMKVEDKLRNYYNPDHIDQVLYSTDSDINEMDLDYFNGRRKGIGLPVTKTNKTKDENKNEIYAQIDEVYVKKDNKTGISNSPLFNILKTSPQTKNITNITSKTELKEYTVENTTKNDNNDKEAISNVKIPDTKPSRRNIIVEKLKKPVKTVHEATETEIKVTRYNEETEVDRVGKISAFKPVNNQPSGNENKVQNVEKLNTTLDEHLGIDDNGVDISNRTVNVDTDILDLTKAIVVHKNCAHKPEDDNKLGLLDQDLNKDNCGKNIILQFNINL